MSGELTLAGAYSIAQDYPSAAAAYEALITIDPDYALARRELAHTYYSEHQYGLARAVYQAAQSPSADEKLHADLDALAQRDGRAATIVQTCLADGTAGGAVCSGLDRAVAACADPSVQCAFQGAQLDYQAHLAEQAGFQMEDAAKALKDWRNYEALPLYQSLIAAEPANTEALFDLSQVYGALRQTHNAMGAFSDELAADPESREAVEGLDRAAGPQPADQPPRR